MEGLGRGPEMPVPQDEVREFNSAANRGEVTEEIAIEAARKAESDQAAAALEVQSNQGTEDLFDFKNDANNRESTEEIFKLPKETVPFEKLPEAEQVKLLDKMLAGMREAIGPVRDYAVFASTAMYLNGEKAVQRGDAEGKTLMKPPGDFDAAVWREEDLDKIRERMRRMPDVVFSNAQVDADGNILRDQDGEVLYDGQPGRYSNLSGQVKVLAGKRISEEMVNGEMQKVAYDFEFFLNSRMVRQDMARAHTTEAQGLRILDLAGLQIQYEANFAYESNVNEVVQQFVEELHTKDPEKQAGLQAFKREIMSLPEVRDDNGEVIEDQEEDVALTDETRAALQRVDLSPHDMQKVFKIQDELDKIDSSSNIPFARLTGEGLMELYAQAYIDAGDDAKALDLKDKHAKVQKLIAERATILSGGSKTKLAKRALNLIQLARMRGQA
ncbi:MAG: hypothetical protein WAZ14_02780 [Patescibacteria group bacterium]